MKSLHCLVLALVLFACVFAAEETAGATPTKAEDSSYVEVPEGATVVEEGSVTANLYIHPSHLPKCFFVFNPDDAQALRFSIQLQEHVRDNYKRRLLFYQILNNEANKNITRSMPLNAHGRTLFCQWNRDPMNTNVTLSSFSTMKQIEKHFSFLHLKNFVDRIVLPFKYEDDFDENMADREITDAKFLKKNCEDRLKENVACAVYLFENDQQMEDVKKAFFYLINDLQTTYTRFIHFWARPETFFPLINRTISESDNVTYPIVYTITAGQSILHERDMTESALVDYFRLLDVPLAKHQLLAIKRKVQQLAAEGKLKLDKDEGSAADGEAKTEGEEPKKEEL